MILVDWCFFGSYTIKFMDLFGNMIGNPQQGNLSTNQYYIEMGQGYVELLDYGEMDDMGVPAWIQQRTADLLDGFLIIYDMFWLVYFTKFTTCFLIDTTTVRVQARWVKINPT